MPIEYNLDMCSYMTVTENFYSWCHLSAQYGMDSQQMVNLHDDKNSEKNFIIMDDDDAPPKQVHVPSEALNTIYKYYRRNLWEKIA